MGLHGALRSTFRFDDAALAGRNNFHLLRLAAALLVLFAHCFHLLGRAGDEPIGRWFIWMDASRLGVAMFFLISGFLVSQSWNNRRDLAGFLAARALRVAPALWVALVATVLMLGVVATTLPAADYLRETGTWKYLGYNAVLHTQYLLPGVFESNPVPGVNGSLWTIPLEVVLYLILAVAGWSGLLAPDGAGAQLRERLTTYPLASAALFMIAALLVHKVVRTGVQYYSLAGYFLLGVAIYRFRRWLRWNLVHALFLLAAAGLARTTWAGPALLAAALTCGLFTVALHPALRMPRTWLHRNDYSYGAYLYGFPVQQTLIALGVREPLLLLAYCLPLTLACAALSWHLVERPLLDRKQFLCERLAALTRRGAGGA